MVNDSDFEYPNPRRPKKPHHKKPRRAGVGIEGVKKYVRFGFINSKQKPAWMTNAQWQYMRSLARRVSTARIRNTATNGTKPKSLSASNIPKQEMDWMRRVSTNAIREEQKRIRELEREWQRQSERDRKSVEDWMYKVARRAERERINQISRENMRRATEEMRARDKARRERERIEKGTSRKRKTLDIPNTDRGFNPADVPTGPTTGPYIDFESFSPSMRGRQNLEKMLRWHYQTNDMSASQQANLENLIKQIYNMTDEELDKWWAQNEELIRVYFDYKDDYWENASIWGQYKEDNLAYLLDTANSTKAMPDLERQVKTTPMTANTKWGTFYLTQRQ